jgi:hypothetical protein
MLGLQVPGQLSRQVIEVRQQDVGACSVKCARFTE